MEIGYEKKVKEPPEGKPGLRRWDFLRMVGVVAAMVGVVLLGQFFKALKAYGAEATVESVTQGKFHIGDKITKENVDLVKNLISASIYDKVTRGAVLEIAPVTPLDLIRPPAYQELTKKNAGLAKLDENKNLWTKDGKIWPGGLPFPEPKTGLEVMYNFVEKCWIGDDWYLPTAETWINRQGKIYKKVDLHWYGIYLRGRFYYDPKPTYTGCEDQQLRQIVFYTGPFDINGLGVLIIRYQDARKLDDMYGYIPALRRTRRLSTAQRDDSPDGSDIVMVDYNAHDDPLSMWDFKIVEKKLMLAPGFNLPAYEDPWNPPRDGNGKYRRSQVELRPTTVIEATPVGGRRAYSKKILYQDDAAQFMSNSEGYDQRGVLWRSYQQLMGQDPKRSPTYSCRSPECYDHQADSMTALVQKHGSEVNVGLKVTDWFDVKCLTKLGVK